MAEHTMSWAVQKNIKIPPIAYDYDGAEELVIKKDISYCAIGDKELCFDIYYPKEFIPFQSKAVLFINGGGPIEVYGG